MLADLRFEAGSRIAVGLCLLVWLTGPALAQQTRPNDPSTSFAGRWVGTPDNDEGRPPAPIYCGTANSLTVVGGKATATISLNPAEATSPQPDSRVAVSLTIDPRGPVRGTGALSPKAIAWYERTHDGATPAPTVEAKGRALAGQNILLTFRYQTAPLTYGTCRISYGRDPSQSPDQIAAAAAAESKPVQMPTGPPIRGWDGAWHNSDTYGRSLGMITYCLGGVEGFNLKNGRGVVAISLDDGSGHKPDPKARVVVPFTIAANGLVANDVALSDENMAWFKAYYTQYDMHSFGITPHQLEQRQTVHVSGKTNEKSRIVNAKRAIELAFSIPGIKNAGCSRTFIPAASYKQTMGELDQAERDFAASCSQEGGPCRGEGRCCSGLECSSNGEGTCVKR